MTNIHVETIIKRPRPEVAAFVVDNTNDTRWMTTLSESSKETDGPITVGAQVKRVASFLGRQIVYVNEVTELVPNTRLAMRSVQAPFPMTVVYEFEDAPEGTRVRITTGGDATGFYAMAAPLLNQAVKRGVKADLGRLKKLLEAGDLTTEAQRARRSVGEYESKRVGG